MCWVKQHDFHWFGVKLLSRCVFLVYSGMIYDIFGSIMIGLILKLEIFLGLVLDFVGAKVRVDVVS